MMTLVMKMEMMGITMRMMVVMKDDDDNSGK